MAGEESGKSKSKLMNSPFRILLARDGCIGGGKFPGSIPLTGFCINILEELKLLAAVY